MIVKITAILVMAVFYAAYMGKKFSQKRQGVTTNQIAVGNKPRNVMMVEKIMGVATFVVIPVELLSIIFYDRKYTRKISKEINVRYFATMD